MTLLAMKSDLDGHRQVITGGTRAYSRACRRYCSEMYKFFDLLHTFYHALKLDTLRLNQVLEDHQNPVAPDGLSEVGVRAYHAIHDPNRNKTMARNARRIYNKMNEGAMIIPCGVDHLLPLRHKLENLKPLVMVLNHYNTVRP